MLRIDGAGLYVCPDEGDGADSVTLTEENIELTPDANQYGGASGRGFR